MYKIMGLLINNTNIENQQVWKAEISFEMKDFFFCVTKLSNIHIADYIELSLAQPYQKHLQKYTKLTMWPLFLR